MILARRSLLASGLAFLAAPVIIRPGLLMPIPRISLRDRLALERAARIQANVLVVHWRVTSAPAERCLNVTNLGNEPLTVYTDSAGGMVVLQRGERWVNPEFSA